MHAITSMTLSKNVSHGPSPLNGTSHHQVGIPCGWLRLTAISDGGLCKAVRWNLLEINFPTLDPETPTFPPAVSCGAACNAIRPQLGFASRWHFQLTT